MSLDLPCSRCLQSVLSLNPFPPREFPRALSFLWHSLFRLQSVCMGSQLTVHGCYCLRWSLLGRGIRRLILLVGRWGSIRWRRIFRLRRLGKGRLGAWLGRCLWLGRLVIGFGFRWGIWWRWR